MGCTRADAAAARHPSPARPLGAGGRGAPLRPAARWPARAGRGLRRRAHERGPGPRGRPRRGHRCLGRQHRRRPPACRARPRRGRAPGLPPRRPGQRLAAQRALRPRARARSGGACGRSAGLSRPGGRRRGPGRAAGGLDAEPHHARLAAGHRGCRVPAARAAHRHAPLAPVRDARRARSRRAPRRPAARRAPGHALPAGADRAHWTRDTSVNYLASFVRPPQETSL